MCLELTGNLVTDIGSPHSQFSRLTQIWGLDGALDRQRQQAQEKDDGLQ